jgi:hypothetical protein
MPLITAPNLDDADAAYASIVSLYDGRSPEECAHINARLILIFANHIGESQIIAEAAKLSLKTLRQTGPNHS